ncbi:NAD/NADP octopine/nopaline dehydrogenase family protein [Psychromarinibacter sp. C21-152]|uniref:2-dehydropantoate 2-reductase n=1 Tax=Psychromarinibacter sediminicola TaxID=3033385 RepID=A0AAE3TA42_9RHOB|nr:NAD/NADP octopine/nopaline dehydrogenase family protein [Psychromarinibacter sediminicola]MDF0601225.1 NAD/NADP octopine/nopaline dehydrogenase family protein [Psychromarinibacter sediminicola]
MGTKVGLAGAGSIAFGTAAVLHERGHDPMLWSPSGAGTAELADGASLSATGAVETTFTPRIAVSAESLARDNDVLMITLPGYGHKTVMDAFAPHIEPRHRVIVSSHASLGAIYLAQLLAERGVAVPIIAWGTTICTGRRQSGTEVTVNTVRSRVDLCTVPAERSDEALSLCRELFGDRFQPRDGLLAISLSNLNPQNHMGIALGNITRMERGETWSQGQNVTPKVGRLLEELDQERLAIACALGLEVKTIFEHFHLSFHVPVASISEMNQQMHAQGNGGTGPATADSRYVTEDVPYGLVLTAALGRLTGRPAVLHEAGIRIFSAMYGRDFEAENEILQALDLDRYALDDLKRAAQSGLLRHPESAA